MDQIVPLVDWSVVSGQERVAGSEADQRAVCLEVLDALYKQWCNTFESQKRAAVLEPSEFTKKRVCEGKGVYMRGKIYYIAGWLLRRLIVWKQRSRRVLSNRVLQMIEEIVAGRISSRSDAIDLHLPAELHQAGKHDHVNVIYAGPVFYNFTNVLEAHYASNMEADQIFNHSVGSLVARIHDLTLHSGSLRVALINCFPCSDGLSDDDGNDDDEVLDSDGCESSDDADREDGRRSSLAEENEKLREEAVDVVLRYICGVYSRMRGKDLAARLTQEATDASAVTSKVPLRKQLASTSTTATKKEK
jgi:hypothetical protein